MPIKIFGKTYSKFKDAEKEAKRRGKKSPGGYVSTVERAEQGVKTKKKSAKKKKK